MSRRLEASLGPRVAALLERRLRALQDLSDGRRLHPRRREALRPSPLLRRALRRVEQRWHDGDANAVRDSIGAWGPAAGALDAALAARLLAAADQLARIQAPESTLLAFAFELEATLADAPAAASG